jgi:signal peptide peptidase SppA
VPATPFRNTPVVDQPWDGPASEARIDNDAGRAVFERMYAWRDPDGDEDTKAAYALPHHEVLNNGRVASANVNGCRNALSRLPQSRVPEADRDDVRSVLQRHIDRFNDERDSSSEAERDEFVASRVATLPEAVLTAGVRLFADHRAWAIDRRVLGALYALDTALIDTETQLATEAAQPRRPSRSGGGVAVVSLKGVLMPQMGGLFALLFGGGGLQTFQTQFSDAALDPEVDVIVMDIDSPGGMVDQIPETADQIRAARATKPIVAVANTQVASAAYWLASQADEIVVTDSGEVGSVGVYQRHLDLSAAHEQAGIKPTLISAGKYKVEDNPYEPLGDEARAAMQSDVDDYYRMFVRAVARGRGVDVPAYDGAAFGGGRMFHARQARAAGLADAVGTLGDTVRRVASPAGRAALERRRSEASVDLDPSPEPVTYTSTERERLLAVMGQQP